MSTRDPIHAILEDFVVQIRAEVRRQIVAALSGVLDGTPARSSKRIATSAVPAVTVTVSEQEKAYFAGYTDAEGCISIYCNKSSYKKLSPQWCAYVSFSQTNPAVVEKLHAVYGGSLYVRQRGGKNRPQKVLRIQAIAEVRRFLLDVMPHLREKQAQADAVLCRFDSRADHRTNQKLSDFLVQLKAKKLSSVISDCLVQLKAKKLDNAISDYLVQRKAEKLSSAISIVPRRSPPLQARLSCIDCDAKAFSRGYCEKHYQKARRVGRFATAPKGADVPFTYGRVLKEFEAPYFAGYFDGDGCLTIWLNKKHWYTHITFAQTQPDALIELYTIYGGSLRAERVRAVQHRPQLRYQLAQRAAVLALLRDMLPFVVEKRDQVELFLARYRSDMSPADGKQLKGQLSEMKQRAMRLPAQVMSTAAKDATAGSDGADVIADC